ncbi:MAG: peptidase T [Lachnospiraceae bacterium]|nr:peptidase T [Lachnospiraceae bacterium]
MKLADRFLKYVSIDTQSSKDSTSSPSTAKQFQLAELLYQELKEMGIEDVRLDRKYCYIYAGIPSNLPAEKKDVPVIGLIAHMDTSPEISGAGVKARMVENYDGEDVVLNSEQNIVLSPSVYPELKNYIGKTLIVTDGTTLLGADDKAGIAEIMTAVEELLAHPERPHGEIRIAFTPDEEIGAGVDHFDVEAFGADFAYTVDGGAEGELEYETFNAASVNVEINGLSIHPGSAKNRMVNASLLAAELVGYLPAEQTPAHTEGYEGFYHLYGISGTIEKATVSYIIRDHDRNLFEEKKQYFVSVCNLMNQKYGEGTVQVEIQDSYYNMKEMIVPHFHLIETAKKAMEMNQVACKIAPVRGGTDGSRLSYMGIPCPNLYTGGHNYHGRFEYVCYESMKTMVQVIQTILKLYAEK